MGWPRLGGGQASRARNDANITSLAEILQPFAEEKRSVVAWLKHLSVLMKIKEKEI